MTDISAHANLLVVRQEAPQLPELLTTAEVADIFRVDPSTVSKWASRGVLEAVRTGGTVRFRRADVAALLEQAPS